MSPQIWLVRHGETPWTRTRQHTGRTDIGLSPQGEQEARRVGPLLPADAGLVLCSPLLRARRTAELAGLAPDDYLDDLMEWDYGGWEGRTTVEIRADLDDPTWTVWQTPVPPGDTPGEQVDDVGRRAQRVIDRCLPVLDAGHDCILVAHAHLLRILTATWLGLPAVDGRLFVLETAKVSELGFEREQRIIARWNYS